jgi:hypothetical protein
MEITKRMRPVVHMKLEEAEIGYMLALVDFYTDHNADPGCKDSEEADQLDRIYDFSRKIRNELVK